MLRPVGSRRALALRLWESMLLPKRQKRAYAEFYRSARDNETLDARTTLMIHLAAALALGCYP